MLSIATFTVAVLILATIIALHFHRGPAVRGCFHLHSRGFPMKTIAPGGSAIASITALDADGNVVDTGPVSFIDQSLGGLTVTANGDNTATYSVAVGTAPRNFTTLATFVNVLGDTIQVTDTIVVSAPVDAAVSGSFVWTDPPAAKA